MRPTLTCLTAERLRELFHYDLVTGVFTRLVAVGRHGRYKVGDVAGTLKPDGYNIVCVDGTQYKAHRLAWLYVYGVWPSGLIDHKYGKEAGNGIENLREGNNTFNMQNERCARANNKSSGLLGAHAHGKRWRSQIKVDGVLIRLGTADSPEEAHQLYLEAKRRLHPGCTI